jgi:hypothetical protein
MPRAEWHGRSDFAEYAEAVGVSTVEVMAAMETPGGSALVLYSPGVTAEMDEEELAPVALHRAILRRDEDRLLALVEREQVGTLGEFQAKMDELLAQWKGEPQ